MFPLIGSAEVATLFADAALMATALLRWHFMWPRTLGAWLAATSATVGLIVVIVSASAAAAGWGSPANLIVTLGSVAIFLAVRAAVLRSMSRSLAFRRDLARPMGWAWIIPLPMAVFVLALPLGAISEWLLGRP